MTKFPVRALLGCPLCGYRTCKVVDYPGSLGSTSYSTSYWIGTLEQPPLEEFPAESSYSITSYGITRQKAIKLQWIHNQVTTFFF